MPDILLAIPARTDDEHSGRCHEDCPRLRHYVDRPMCQAFPIWERDQWVMRFLRRDRDGRPYRCVACKRAEVTK